PQRDVSTSLDMTNASLLIKFRPIARIFLQNFTGSKFLFSSGQPFQLLDDLLWSKVFRISQRPAAERRETSSQNHSVIRILGRIDDSLFHATSGLIYYQKNQPVSQLFFI